MNDCEKDKTKYMSYVHNVNLTDCKKCKFNTISENIGCEMNCVKAIEKSNLCGASDGSSCDTFLWDSKNKSCLVPIKSTEQYFTKAMSSDSDIGIGSTEGIYPMYVINSIREENDKKNKIKTNDKIKSLLMSQYNNLQSSINNLNYENEAIRTNKTVLEVQNLKEKEADDEVKRKELLNYNQEIANLRERKRDFKTINDKNLVLINDSIKLNKKYDRLNKEKEKELNEIMSKLKTISVKGNRNNDLYRLNNKFINYLVVGLGILFVFASLVYIILRIRG